MTDHNFFSDESGAVTVDWVVLTAALVGLGLAVMGVVSGGLEDLSGDIQSQMSDSSIIRTSFTGGSQASLASACGGVGTYCADQGFVTGDDLTRLETAALNTLATDAGTLGTTADFDGTTYDANLVQNDAGEWGTYAVTGDTDSAFTSNAAANQEYNQLATNEAYQASLADEQSARGN